MNSPVEVVFYGKDKKEIERIWIEGVDVERDIKAPQGARYAIIDPDEHMPDIKRENNSTRSNVKLHWVWDQPTYYDHDINFTPWFNANYYNGFTPGLLFYKGVAPGYSGLTAFEAMWDLNNKKIVGKISRSFNFEENLFNESTLRFNGMRLHGNTGGRITFNGRITNNNTHDFTALASHSALELSALDSNLYSEGDYTTSLLQYSFSKNTKGIIDDVSFKSGIMFGKNFLKSWIEGKTKIKPHKLINFQIRGWAGDFYNDNEIPKQYRTYLSGGIDPMFSSYIYDRTGRSSFAIMQNQYVQKGPAFRGLVKDGGSFVSSTSMTWGINLDLKTRFSPNIFYDIAGGDDYNTYSAAGITIGPVIIPLYQSWEEVDRRAKDVKWVSDRVRLQFNFNLASLLQ